MSHIPNDAMPHAMSHETGPERAHSHRHNGMFSQIADTVREHPKAAMAAGAAVAAGVAAAIGRNWSSGKKSSDFRTESR